MGKGRRRKLAPPSSLPLTLTKAKKVVILLTQFFLAMVPPTTTHQEKNVRVVKGKPVFYEPAELKDARDKITAALWQHKPEHPMTGAVRLITKWCFPKGKDHQDGEYKTTKPDTDNMIKLFKDCMTKVGFWGDDAQVASEITEKFYAELTGIWVMVEEIGG
ncbi:MAG: RusA family crossover junction endodeoxyribonuclease [Clostridia bacterium]|nr:RusA family crossover junction endodeoxyribonuclease [Clostridia bacterium]